MFLFYLSPCRKSLQQTACHLQVGEIMDGRYEVFATHGKGVFSTVLRARDQKTGNGAEVAIKMIRANETMYKAAQTEKVSP